MKKSYFAQFLLTVLFGPLGLFYSSVAAAIAMMIAAIVFAAITYGVALLVIWPLCILIGFGTVMRFNDGVSIEEARHEQLIAAVKAGQKGG